MHLVNFKEIFNNYSEFTLVYLDDVLVFSNSINQYFEHLNKFFNIIRDNGLVLSKRNMKLFQNKIRFLGFKVFEGTITPISRAIEFADKFLDELKYKTQL